ncbi:hypothetical protein Back11_46770 [Paenibacillus baekrokdamisoli]|uniref:Uncharacterized protein n=1 Tax=Paenibacillus baekrokdamisoli TaxID=1712516 RepID=A0A3G9IYB8_9BACL|nr:DHHW family protein [Paenibacillus baekrokdamisoli]MBB3073002.1 hypothetical protein [Paenibacillus baekrokdamisoli]BBH23332.1 hypothetical protein Back11_46770 [Paenibacillus baekrokdamisoli]
MKLQAKLNLALFLLFIFGVAAVNLLRPQSQSVSELEQRSIQQAPAFTTERLFAGDYTREYDNYFSDTFTNRTSLVKVGADLKALKGFTDEEGASIFVQNGGDNMAVSLNGKIDTSDDKKDHTSTSGTKKDDKTDLSNVNATKYLILKDQAMTLFAYSAQAADEYAKVLNQFKNSIDPKIHVYSLLAPTSVEYIKNEKYKAMSDSQKEAFAQINKQLEPSIGQIDAYGALDKHSDEYIYFRTDHHWTALGAYYAYTNFMNAIGEKAIPLSQYKTGTIEDYLGTAYKATLSVNLKDHPDTITYYSPFTKYQYSAYSSTNKALKRNVVDPAYAKKGNGLYAVFLDGDYPWGEITTAKKNGKRIAVIKDSYANSFIPFLLPHFEKIYIVDPRYYKGSLTDFMKKQQITDVLFLNNSTVARNTGISKLIGGLLPVSN